MPEFLGQGWAFPVRVNARGGLDWSADAKSIDEAIWIDPAAPSDIPLAPLTRDHVLPLASRSRAADL